MDPDRAGVQHVPEHVEVVAALLEHPAAGARDILSPPLVLDHGQSGPEILVGLDGEDLAEAAGADDLSDPLVEGRVAQHEPDHGAPGRSGLLGMPQRGQVLERRRDRLLEQQRESAVHRLDRVGGVLIIRRRDHRGVEVVVAEHRDAVVQELRRGADEVGEGFAPPRVGIGERGQSDVRLDI